MSSVLFISGTRPEIIKLAPLYHLLSSEAWANVTWLHTGQHEEMANQTLSCFRITPDISLKRQGKSLSEFSIGCRAQLEPVMAEKKWSLIVVQGDTESTFLGALAGYYHGVPVAHIEAGLRTHNLNAPFPEEGIRQMVSRIAQFHFAPSEFAHQALLAEAIPANKITVTGNTVIDAQLWVTKNHNIRRTTNGRGHMLVTIHRRENWGNDVESICHAIAEIANKHPELDILFPVHLNPVIQVPVRATLGQLPNVKLAAPLDYLDMQQALINAWIVLTDSGGLQEEAPTFGVPLLVLREETERTEAVEAGCAHLVGANRQTIVEKVEELLQNSETYRHMQQANNPFGDGQACKRITAHLEKALTTPHYIS